MARRIEDQEEGCDCQEESLDWSLQITKADNGFIIDTAEPGGVCGLSVFEINGNLPEREAELELMRNLLLEVKEFFGVMYQKHDKKNLRVVIEGGTEEEQRY